MPDQADELRKIMAAQRGEQKHAPEEDDDQKMVEPLSIGEYSQWISDADGRIIAYDEGTLGIGIGDDRTKSRARRIVACVNACRGLSTETLEMFGDTVTHGMAYHLGQANSARDEAEKDRVASIKLRDVALRECDESRAMVAELLRSIKNAHYNHAMHPFHVDIMDAGPDENWPTKLMHASCMTCALIAKAQALLA